MEKVLIKRLDNGADLPLPQRQTTYSAGLDLHAAVEDPVTVAPGERALIPCGFSIALPEGYEAQIRPRSGLAYKHGLTILNTPGTIDADYRGEVCILLINLGEKEFTITRGLRAAQMVIAPTPSLEISCTETLPETNRNAGGFGSTGV